MYLRTAARLHIHTMPVMYTDTHTSYCYLAPQYRPFAHATGSSRAARLLRAPELCNAFDEWYDRVHANCVASRAGRAALRCAFDGWYDEARRGCGHSSCHVSLRWGFDMWYREMCARLNSNAVLEAMLQRHAAALV